jgi:hypothetical protein
MQYLDKSFYNLKAHFVSKLPNLEANLVAISLFYCLQQEIKIILGCFY